MYLCIIIYVCMRRVAGTRVCRVMYHVCICVSSYMCVCGVWQAPVCVVSCIIYVFVYHHICVYAACGRHPCVSCHVSYMYLCIIIYVCMRRVAGTRVCRVMYHICICV